MKQIFVPQGWYSQHAVRTSYDHYLGRAAGWPDWSIFWKDEVAQNNGDILGYFLLKQL